MSRSARMQALPQASAVLEHFQLSRVPFNYQPSFHVIICLFYEARESYEGVRVYLYNMQSKL